MARKRKIEDLVRWDCREYIDQALPDVDEDGDCDDDWNDNAGSWSDDDDEFDLSDIAGYAEIDPRDPRYSVFRVTAELKPGDRQSLRLYRGNRFPNTPSCQRNHFWYWLCPECDRRCLYLYTLPRSAAATCRKCWNLPYRSQSKSHAQRQRERIAKNKPLNMAYSVGRFGDMYWHKGDRMVCSVPPQPPRGWVPADLMEKYHCESHEYRQGQESITPITRRDVASQETPRVSEHA